jgi:hypothetical protein
LEYQRQRENDRFSDYDQGRSRRTKDASRRRSRSRSQRGRHNSNDQGTRTSGSGYSGHNNEFGGPDQDMENCSPSDNDYHSNEPPHRSRSRARQRTAWNSRSPDRRGRNNSRSPDRRGRNAKERWPKSRARGRSSILEGGVHAVSDWLRELHFSSIIQRKFLEANICGPELSQLSDAQLTEFGMERQNILRFHQLMQDLLYC